MHSLYMSSQSTFGTGRVFAEGTCKVFDLVMHTLDMPMYLILCNCPEDTLCAAEILFLFMFSPYMVCERSFVQGRIFTLIAGKVPYLFMHTLDMLLQIALGLGCEWALWAYEFLNTFTGHVSKPSLERLRNGCLQ